MRVASLEETCVGVVLATNLRFYLQHNPLSTEFLKTIRNALKYLRAIRRFNN